MSKSLRRLSWAGLMAACCAAAIVAAETASIGGVLVWATVGLLELPETLGLGAALLVAIATVAAGLWMFRAAYATETRAEDPEPKG